MPRSLVSLRLYVKPHFSVSWHSNPAEDLMRFKGDQLRQLHAQHSFELSWDNISVWCVNLKSLDLSPAHTYNYIPSVTAEKRLCSLVKQLVQLEELALPGATDSVLYELGKCCPRLVRLFFQGWRTPRAGPLMKQLEVSDFGVMSLAEGCLELRVLSLGGCSTITRRAIWALSDHCRKIEVLELSGCTALFDDEIELLLERVGSSLLRLELLTCTKLTPGVIRTVLHHALAKKLRLRVLSIPNSMKSESELLLSDLKKVLPYLSVRGNNNGLHWDGFYHSPRWSYCS